MRDGRHVFAVVGLDHRHIYEMTGGMLSAGMVCKGWWTEGEPEPLAGYVKRFPDLPRVADRRALLEDPEIDLIVTAARFDHRAGIAITAMRNGKDVMTDKPGCIHEAELEAIRKTVAETGRIWSVNFSERFQVAAAQKVLDLVRDGVIGRVVQTLGMGPHRMNARLRPAWFFDKAAYGGILADIGSHQIDQFLMFTGSSRAEIVAATAGNIANPAYPDFEDFGEVLLRGDGGHGYVRVDWYTPDGLPTWGDGRLTILGTQGYIELRKYVDVAGRPGKNHLFLVNGSTCEHIDCSGVKLRYFDQLAADIRDRTETAMPQDHAFRVTALALAAQKMARPTVR
jgi:predicted dehydrogenase